MQASDVVNDRSILFPATRADQPSVDFIKTMRSDEDARPHDVSPARHDVNNSTVPHDRNASPGQDAPNHHTDDRMLRPDIFTKLQAKIGRAFTIDACCNDDGSNKLVDRFCSGSNDFLQTDVAGETIWLNPPFRALEPFIRHYVQCKRRRPHDTSACIVVPVWHGSHERLLKGMQVLQEFTKGTRLFTAPTSDGGRRQMPGIPWPVRIYYDPPVPRLATIANHASLAVEDSAHTYDYRMLYAGNAAGVAATVAFDSLASANFVSTRWLQRANISVPTGSGTVILGDGRTPLATNGTIRLRVAIGRYVDHLVLHVMDMDNVFDIILGDPWLRDTRSVLNFREGEATIYKKFKRFVVKALRDEPCRPISSDPAVTRSPPLLTALQFKRSVRKTNAPAFIVHIKAQDEHDKADAPRPDGGGDDTSNVRMRNIRRALHTLLNDFDDVFRDELPELPPERDVAHYDSAAAWC